MELLIGGDPIWINPAHIVTVRWESVALLKVTLSTKEDLFVPLHVKQPNDLDRICPQRPIQIMVDTLEEAGFLQVSPKVELPGTFSVRGEECVLAQWTKGYRQAFTAKHGDLQNVLLGTGSTINLPILNAKVFPHGSLRTHRGMKGFLEALRKSGLAEVEDRFRDGKHIGYIVKAPDKNPISVLVDPEYPIGVFTQKGQSLSWHEWDEAFSFLQD